MINHTRPGRGSSFQWQVSLSIFVLSFLLVLADPLDCSFKQDYPPQYVAYKTPRAPVIGEHWAFVSCPLQYLSPSVIHTHTQKTINSHFHTRKHIYVYTRTFSHSYFHTLPIPCRWQTRRASLGRGRVDWVFCWYLWPLFPHATLQHKSEDQMGRWLLLCGSETGGAERMVGERRDAREDKRTRVALSQ